MKKNKKNRINGTLSDNDFNAWRKKMKSDGFKAFWTWIEWVVSKYVNSKND